MVQRKIRIIGVPLDLGARRLGVALGPTAIRYADLHSALSYNGFIVTDHGDIQIPMNWYIDRQDPENHDRETIAAVSNELASIVNNAIEAGDFPLILGGDHSVAIGSVAGSATGAANPGLIWLDAHPDANLPETSPSGNIHGMSIAVALGYGYPELVDCHHPGAKISPKQCCIIGTHNIDRAEKVFLEKLGLFHRTLTDIEQNGIVGIMDEVINHLANCDRIHVSLDIDVIDPLYAPGTGIISKGGLTFREISYVMKRLSGVATFAALDCIEVNPLADIRNQTSELAVELIVTALGGSYGDYERNYLAFQQRGSE